jgi:phospholipase/carboxylesterase
MHGDVDRLSLEHLVRQPAGGTAGPAPALILLHGFGSNEQDLFGLAPGVDQRFLVVSARAPVALGDGQFGWFRIERTPAGLSMDHAGARESGALLARFVGEAVERYGADPTQVYLGGFSQGAIMALGLALTQPERVAGIVAMSGRLPPPDTIAMASPARLAGLPIMVVHGTEDPVLPIEHGREARDVLSRLPVELTYREHPIGHYSTPQSLVEVAAWLSARLDTRAHRSGAS